MNHRFKVGDRVRLLKPGISLTVGDIYTVIDVDDICLYIQDNEGDRRHRPKDHFELVESHWPQPTSETFEEFHAAYEQSCLTEELRHLLERSYNLYEGYPKGEHIATLRDAVRSLTEAYLISIEEQSDED